VKVVSDASPLIALARIDCVELAEYAQNGSRSRPLRSCRSCNNIGRGLFPHGKRNEYHSHATAAQGAAAHRIACSDDAHGEARKLIRKTSAEHAGLFRRLAK
jgi:hypothetical protein